MPRVLRADGRFFSFTLCCEVYLTIIPGGNSVLVPRWCYGKEPAHQCRKWFIPRVRKIPGEGNVKPLQYSHLEIPTDRGA